LISVALGVTAVWIGILMDCVTGYPATFWITALFFVLYIIVEAYVRFVAKSDR
jgi:hypothetical protein